MNNSEKVISIIFNSCIFSYRTLAKLAVSNILRDFMQEYLYTISIFSPHSEINFF